MNATRPRASRMARGVTQKAQDHPQRAREAALCHRSLFRALNYIRDSMYRKGRLVLTGEPFKREWRPGLDVVCPNGDEEAHASASGEPSGVDAASDRRP